MNTALQPKIELGEIWATPSTDKFRECLGCFAKHLESLGYEVLETRNGKVKVRPSHHA